MELRLITQDSCPFSFLPLAASNHPAQSAWRRHCEQRGSGTAGNHASPGRKLHVHRLERGGRWRLEHRGAQSDV